MPPTTPSHLVTHPVPTSAERLIPKEVWPDLKGVRTAKSVTWPNTVAKFREFCKLAANFPILSLDLETSGLRPFHGSRLVGVSLALYDGKSIQAGYFNFRHQGHPAHPWCKTHGYSDNGEPLSGKALAESEGKKCEACKRGACPGYAEKATVIPLSELQLLVPLFKKILIAGQNIKYDAKVLSMDGVPVPDRTLDSMLIAHLWDENQRKYNLNVLASEMGEKKLGDTIAAYQEEHNLSVEKYGHAQVPHELETTYAIMDTVLVLKRLQYERDRWEACADPRLIEVFQIENACTPAVAQMEINGMKLDVDYVKAGIAELESDIADLQKSIYKEAGKEFNVKSDEELWEVLAARGHQPRSFTLKEHKPSLTDFDLSQYGDKLCDFVKGHRSRSKTLGTYFKPFLETHIDANHILHADFWIHGTVSGRFSCKEPNLQNLVKFEKFGTRVKTGSIAQAVREGIRSEDEESPHLEVRRCFIPRDKDHSLIFADYAQMELRVFAEYADEKFMIQALADGKDIHAETAKKVFPNFPDEKDDPVLYGYFRQLAKQISFGILYGEGKNKLATQLDVPVDETIRLCQLVIKCDELGFDTKTCATLTPEECASLIEDQKVMTTTRQWSGIKMLEKDVMRKVNPEPLEEFIFGDPERKAQNRRLMYSANTFLGNFHGQFPKIKQFTKGIEKAIASRGYIFNKYGRRYHLPSDKAYVGINRLVQGTSADMVKIAMWRIHKLLQGTRSAIVSQVHDEIQIDLHHSEVHLVNKIKEAMEYFPNFGVNMQVDIKYSHLAASKQTKWVGEEEFIASLKEYKNAKEVHKDEKMESGKKRETKKNQKWNSKNKKTVKV